ncbi:MAG: hypothetical protein ABJB86_02920 [Bacteroidota bacterium]
MKLTSKILIVMLLLFTSGLFASNMLLKRQYDKVDKTDIYWTYEKVLEQPFRHLKIDGGNLTRIVYRQSAYSSVRVAKDWYGYQAGQLKAIVKNDTLYLTIPNTYRNINEKNYLQWTTVLRIFSPELLSVAGTNTNILMEKLNQKSVEVKLSGKSGFEAESIVPQFDSITIDQSDSSNVQFEMDPALKAPGNFHVNYLRANLKGVSFLDIGHAKIDSLQLSVTDSSGIFLSGSAINKRSLGVQK